MTPGRLRNATRVLRRALVVVAGAGAVLFALARPSAASPVYTLFGTGMGANPSSASGVDPNWNIVALAASASGFPTPPYQAIVPKAAPVAWLGGGNPQTGYTVDQTTYYWISTGTASSSVISGTNSWIAAQTFNVPESANYDFDFYATADNELTFYIDGSVSTTNPDQPTIVGGTQIGNTLSGVGVFGSIHNFTDYIYLTAGTHTAYAVVRDWPNKTGVLISESTFTSVPEIDPAGVASVMALLAGTLGLLERRRGRAGSS